MAEILTLEGFAFRDSKAHERLDKMDLDLSNIDESLSEKQAKLCVTPVEFGAVGNGINDDTTAFENWIAHIKESGAMGYIPNGNYIIKNSRLQILDADNFCIIGESKDKTVINFPSDNGNVLNCIDVRNCNQFEIGGFTIVCKGGISDDYGTGIYLKDCNFANVHDVDVVNCSFKSVLVYNEANENCKEIHIERVRVYGVENQNEDDNGNLRFPYGFILVNCVDSTVKNCHIENMRWFGYEFKNYCKNSYFIDCTAKNCVTACHIGCDIPDIEYACENCGFVNIHCYDTDIAIEGERYNNISFDGIKANYSSDFVSKFYEGHTVRISKATNSYFSFTIFNAPYGGCKISNESCYNYIEMPFVSLSASAPDKIIRINGEDSVDNFIEIKARPLSATVDLIESIIHQNIIFDKMIDSVGDYSSRQKRSFKNIGKDKKLTSVFNECAASLNRSHYSGDGRTSYVFVGENLNLEMRFQPDSQKIEFVFTDGTNKYYVPLTKNGITFVEG